MLKGQLALSGMLYIVLVPLFFLVLLQLEWPGHLLLWFFPILLLEHVNQEVSRLLVAVSEQIFASIVLFVRQASWAIVVVSLMISSPDSRNLDVVMGCWCGAGVAAAILGMWKIKKLKMGGWAQPIDWVWVRRGIAVSAAFLVATLALRGIQTIDRYWLDALAGVELVGAYVLFMGVAGALLVFVDAAIFSFGYPKLIEHNRLMQYSLARSRVRRMLVETLAACAFFGSVSWVALPVLLGWIGNSAYQNAIFLFPWVLAAMMVNAVSMVPHFGLYGMGKDQPIIHSHLAALPVFCFTVLVFGFFEPVIAVPAGLLAAFVFILIWKTVAYLKLQSRQMQATSSPNFVSINNGSP